jgi:signal transduction histidine kinase
LAVALDGNGAVSDAVQRMALALGAATGAWLTWRGWRRDDGRLLVPGVVLAALSAADILRPLADPGAMPWQPWALALFFGAAAWLLLLRFVETLNTLELLNIDLEDLVRVRTSELQAQFERVRELERRQTIAGERERLMRDMHDGVGGHLVSLLAMIEAGRSGPQQLSTAVRDALDDMRLMIDSLDPVDDDLNAVLAMWNDRLAPRLRGAGVVLHWDVDMLPSVPGLTPARVLHVLRILQEAVTNAVRHGRAQTLWLTAGVDAALHQVQLSLRDDGCGFDPEVVGTGRGLKNMRRRAAEVGAELQLVSRPGSGAQVTLRLPLARPEAPVSPAGP